MRLKILKTWDGGFQFRAKDLDTGKIADGFDFGKIARDFNRKPIFNHKALPKEVINVTDRDKSLEWKYCGTWLTQSEFFNYYIAETDTATLISPISRFKKK